MFKYFLTEEGTQWQLLNGGMRAVFQECPTSYCFNDSFIVHSAACLEGGGGEWDLVGFVAAFCRG